MSRLRKMANSFVNQADKGKLSELTEGLLKDLASMQVLYQQLKMFHWVSTGQNYIEIHRFIDEIADAVLEKIDLLAERLVYLGVTPINEGEQVNFRSYVSYGRIDGSFDQNSAMTTIDNSLDQVINGLRSNYTKAEELTDIGTSQLVQEIVFEFESLQHHVDSFRSRFASPLEHDINRPNEVPPTQTVHTGPMKPFNHEYDKPEVDLHKDDHDEHQHDEPMNHKPEIKDHLDLDEDSDKDNDEDNKKLPPIPNRP